MISFPFLCWHQREDWWVSVSFSFFPGCKTLTFCTFKMHHKILLTSFLYLDITLWDWHLLVYKIYHRSRRTFETTNIHPDFTTLLILWFWPKRSLQAGDGCPILMSLGIRTWFGITMFMFWEVLYVPLNCCVQLLRIVGSKVFLRQQHHMQVQNNPGSLI